MFNRIDIAFRQVLGFLRNPSEHLSGDRSDYRSLRDIAAVILLIELPIVVYQISDNLLVFSIFFVVVVLLIWPLSWLVLNFKGYIFNYFLEWVNYKKFLVFQPDLLTSQRIVVYVSVGMLINTIPIPHINYVGDIISILLIGVGLKALYGLKISHGIGLALIYQVLIFAILFSIKFLLELLV